MAHITIENESPRVAYAPTSPTSSFAFNFSIFDASDLKVYINNALLSSSNYTVTLTPGFTGGYPGGSVTLNTAVDDVSVVLQRDVPIERTTDFPSSGPLQIESLNTQLDKFVAMLQQIAARAPLVPVGSSYTNLTLPNPEAGKAIVWKADLSGFENQTLTIPVGSFALASQSQAEAGTDNATLMTPLRVRQAIRVVDKMVSVIDFGGLPGTVSADTDPDAAVGINAALAHAEANNLGVYFPPGIYPLDARINTPGEIVGFYGSQGGGQPTILYKRYVEADALRGVISFGAWGGTVRDLQFAAKPGSSSGGSSISAILPNNAANIGLLHLENVYSSMGDGTNYNLVISGAQNVNVGGPGYRSTFAHNIEFFGCALGCMLLIDVHHFFATNVLLATTGGSVPGGVVLDIQGSSTVDRYNDDIHIHSGLIAGNVSVNFLNRSSFMVPVTGNLTYVSNNDKVTWLRVDGTLTGTATNSLILYKNAIVETGSNANGTYVKYADGMIEQWGTKATDGSGNATVTFPTPFASAVHHAEASPSDTPAANTLLHVNCFSRTTTGMTLKSYSITTAPAVAAVSLNCSWYAKGV